jgi:hypothetical protein
LLCQIAYYLKIAKLVEIAKDVVRRKTPYYICTSPNNISISYINVLNPFIANTAHISNKPITVSFITLSAFYIFHCPFPFLFNTPFSYCNLPLIILRGLTCFFLQRKLPIIFITRYALPGFRHEKSSFSLNEKSISHRNLVMKMIGNNKAEKTVNPRNHNEGREKILILKRNRYGKNNS